MPNTRLWTENKTSADFRWQVSQPHRKPAYFLFWGNIASRSLFLIGKGFHFKEDTSP